jgi:hypothetical protein
MTDGRLYLGIGLPSIAALVGILVNAGCFVSLNSRMSRLEDRIDVTAGKLADLDKRMVRIENKLGIQPR